MVGDLKARILAHILHFRDYFALVTFFYQLGREFGFEYDRNAVIGLGDKALFVFDEYQKIVLCKSYFFAVNNSAVHSVVLGFLHHCGGVFCH